MARSKRRAEEQVESPPTPFLTFRFIGNRNAVRQAKTYGKADLIQLSTRVPGPLYTELQHFSIARKIRVAALITEGIALLLSQGAEYVGDQSQAKYVRDQEQKRDVG